MEGTHALLDPSDDSIRGAPALVVRELSLGREPGVGCAFRPTPPPLKFTVRRHKFNKDSLSVYPECGIHHLKVVRASAELSVG